jgi:hypothetical protein
MGAALFLAIVSAWATDLEFGSLGGRILVWCYPYMILFGLLFDGEPVVD